MVYATISPILEAVIHNTGRKKLQLSRGKGIVSTGGPAGGMKEFLMLDQILGAEGSYVVTVKAMRTSVVAAMKQCLLMLRDASKNNVRGEFYEFVTAGEYLANA